MSELLLQRQKAARRFKVPFDGKTVVFLRPRPGDLAMRSGDQLHALGMLSDFAVDWEGFTAADLVVSGGPELVDFEKELWTNWLYENPGSWEVLANALTDEMGRHAAAVESAAKKSQTG